MFISSVFRRSRDAPDQSRAYTRPPTRQAVCDAGSVTPIWPLDDLTLTGPQLVLRPVRETDMDPLVAAFPDDFDLDPSYPSLVGVAGDLDRARRLQQSIWRHRGCWKIHEWALDFGVWRGGELIGIQPLEGSQFPTERTVDTASWIVKPFRGNGFGGQAREAVLAFAFEHLNAERAITSAVTTNQASLAVSRRLGYRDDGIRPHDTGDDVVDLQHLVMTRDDWAKHSRDAITVNGFDACRPFFGTA